MTLENETVKIGGSMYKFTEGMLLQEDGNSLVLIAVDPNDETTRYRLEYTRLKGATSEEILQQALQSGGVRMKTAEEVIVEEPILQTYDLYEFERVEEFN